MSTNKLAMHTKAVNLARRYSVQNENDLLQENFCEEAEPIGYTRNECQELSRHLMHLKSLPTECQKYNEVVTGLRRRDSDTTDGTSILG